jgi:hypothetical protein
MDSLFNFSIRAGRALVLPRVFGPRIHQERFDVAVRIFEVLKDSPSKGAVTSPNTSILMHCLDKRAFLFKVDIILNRDQNRASIDGNRVFFQNCG